MNPQHGPDPVFGSAMRAMSRSHIADIWRRGNHGEPLNAEDQAYFQAMRQHPEYGEVWEHSEELGHKEVLVHGANPFLHVSIHAVVEQQIANRTPAEVDQALFRLTHHGVERHEAVHRIGGLLMELMAASLRDTKPFDLTSYQRRLRSLKP